MNKQIKVSTAIMWVAVVFVGTIVGISMSINKETPIPKTETKIEYVEAKYPISVIEESEKCKELGGKFDIDISEDVFGKELNMKCEKVIPVTINLKNTETLFNYSLFINK